MALVILDKYATDPDFREVLRKYGPAVVPPIAQADAGPQTIAYLQGKNRRSFKESLALVALFAAGDNGQAVIRTIKDDGLERVAQLGDSSVQFYQFLPLYDVIHLGNVMRRGHAPTSGEMTWALIDGCFVVADVLSLAAIQPEGAVAAEALRSEVKGAVGQGVTSVGRELGEVGGESAGEALARQGAGNVAERLARWWTVRSAGGIFQVLRRLPEALPRLSLSQITEMAGPLCAKAGMRITSWQPVRFLKEGAEVVFRIPPERGIEVPVRADDPGRRRCRRLSEDGRTSEEPTPEPASSAVERFGLGSFQCRPCVFKPTVKTLSADERRSTQMEIRNEESRRDPTSFLGPVFLRFHPSFDLRSSADVLSFHSCYSNRPSFSKNAPSRSNIS